MSAKPRQVEVTLENRIESIDLGEEVARRVASTAGFSDDERDKIALSVRECLINAYQHGNRREAERKIGLSLLLYPDRLVAEISDEGNGFDPAALPSPLEDDRLLAASGRGVFLCGCFMDKLEVDTRRNGGATVILTKHLNSHGPAGAANRGRAT